MELMRTLRGEPKYKMNDDDRMDSFIRTCLKSSKARAVVAAVAASVAKHMKQSFNLLLNGHNSYKALSEVSAKV